MSLVVAGFCPQAVSSAEHSSKEDTGGHQARGKMLRIAG